MFFRSTIRYSDGSQMFASGEKEREAIRLEFDRSIMSDFQGAKIASDTGSLSLRATDARFGILGPIEIEREDTRSWVHSNHTQLRMVWQRVYQVPAGYEGCNDADFALLDPALRLAIGKGHEAGAGQSDLSGPGCSRACWLTTSSTCSVNSTSWRKRPSGQSSGSLGV